jgi:hypothetical protein
VSSAQSHSPIARISSISPIKSSQSQFLHILRSPFKSGAPYSRVTLPERLFSLSGAFSCAPHIGPLRGHTWQVGGQKRTKRGIYLFLFLKACQGLCLNYCSFTSKSQIRFSYIKLKTFSFTSDGNFVNIRYANRKGANT